MILERSTNIKKIPIYEVENVLYGDFFYFFYVSMSLRILKTPINMERPI